MHITCFRSHFIRFTKNDLQQLKNGYDSNGAVQAFLTNYDYDDVAAIEFDTNSTSLWNISPPGLQCLLIKLRANDTLPFRMKFKFVRNSHGAEGDISTFTQFLDLANEANIRYELLKMLEPTNGTSRELRLSSLLPKFLKVGCSHPVFEEKQISSHFFFFHYLTSFPPSPLL